VALPGWTKDKERIKGGVEGTINNPLRKGEQTKDKCKIGEKKNPELKSYKKSDHSLLAREVAGERGRLTKKAMIKKQGETSAKRGKESGSDREKEKLSKARLLCGELTRINEDTAQNGGGLAMCCGGRKQGKHKNTEIWGWKFEN